ncbi:MAG: HD domain-containing protein [Clostridia bacterium]|nr:HD domain-containing protein [Clostridia bacterium]
MNKDIEFLQEVLISENITKSINDNLEKLLNVIPEIKQMIGFEHNHPHHHLDVWQHTLCALSFCCNDFDIRLALLLHDIGKPHSFQDSDGVRHFKGHADVSSQIASVVLKKLGFDDKYADYICKIILHHDTPLTLEDIQKNPELSKKIFEVQKCDAMAHNPVYNKKRLEYITDITKLFDKNNNKTKI